MLVCNNFVVYPLRICC